MFFKKWFKKFAADEPRPEFNSWLLVSFDFEKKDPADIFAYQDELENIVNPSGLGEVDGNEIAVDLSGGEYWIICSNPEQVFNLIKESLLRTKLVNVRVVKKRSIDEEVYSPLFKR